MPKYSQQKKTKMDLFEILLDRQNGLYNAGDFLVGRIKVNINKKVQINKMKILLNGIVKISWLQNRTSLDYTKYIYLNKNCIHLELVLLEKKILEAGDHELPFSIKLPDDLRSSFQSNYGSINYSLKAVLDLRWNLAKTIRKELTIFSKADMKNSNNELGFLNSVLMCKNSKFLFFNSKNIQTTVKINKTAFVPGEPINFNAIIKNQSSQDIKCVKMNLIQNCKLNVDNESKVIHKKISSIECEKLIEKNSDHKWICSNWILPQICPSTNGENDFIQINYDLEFKLKTKKLKIPIFIGTTQLIEN